MNKQEYLISHTSDTFETHIETIYDEIERSFLKGDAEEANRWLRDGLELIVKDVESIPCQGVAAAFLIAATAFSFQLEGVDPLLDLFYEGFAETINGQHIVLLKTYRHYFDIIERRRQNQVHCQEHKS